MNPLQQHWASGVAYTLGFEPQPSSSQPHQWSMGPMQLDLSSSPNGSRFTPGQVPSSVGEAAAMGLPGVLGIGSTIATAAMGFSQGGLLGAGAWVAQDLAVSAAAVHHIPQAHRLRDGKLHSFRIGTDKFVNAMVPESRWATPVRLGLSMVEGAMPYVRPVMGSAVGSMVGGFVAGPVGAFAGGMIGSHSTNAAARKAGGQTVVAGFKAAGRVAARHPLAGMAALGAVVVGGAGYAAYRAAGPVMGLGMGVAQTAMRYQDRQKQIDTAGDLAAWNTRRAATAGQMAHRNRQMLNMSMRDTFNATATKYHHNQRIF